MKSIKEMKSDCKKMRHYQIKAKFKFIKIAVFVAFVFVFSISASAAAKEYQVREEYAMRDLYLAASMQPIMADSKIGLTWDEIIKNINKLTVEWVENGRHNPVYYYFFDPKQK